MSFAEKDIISTMPSFASCYSGLIFGQVNLITLKNQFGSINLYIACFRIICVICEPNGKYHIYLLTIDLQIKYILDCHFYDVEGKYFRFTYDNNILQ